LIFILRAVFINLRKIYVHFSGSLDAAIALHRIVERLPQVLHMIRLPISPFALGMLSPFLIVSLDPHLGQSSALPSTPLDSRTMDCTGVLLEIASRAFSEGCFKIAGA